MKALSRSKVSVERECVGDLRKHSRNLDPVYHPMQRSREYTRAITSAKMERMVRFFFLGGLEALCFSFSFVLEAMHFLNLDYYFDVRWSTVNAFRTRTVCFYALDSLRNHWWVILVTDIKMLFTTLLFHEIRCCLSSRDGK